MAKTFRTVGSGSAQTTEPIENNKIPVYDTKTDAESDLANLAVGQIIATKDEGNETSTPVDVVEDGNMHAVTSNAVAELFQVRSYTLTTDGTSINSMGYIEKEISNTDLPIAIQGYNIVSIKTEQQTYDAFLYNLHKSNNRWRLTIFNCAPVSQTIPTVDITITFMQNI